MRALIAFLLVVTVGTACAAPAPFRRPEPVYEVVFDARTEARAKIAVQYVNSPCFADRLFRSDAIPKQLADVCGVVRGQKLASLKQGAWLDKHLTAVADGQRVRVRLDAPLVILQFVAAELSRDLRRYALDLRDRLAAMEKRLAREDPRVLDASKDELRTLHRFAECLLEPLKLIRPPAAR